jgi:drug/metabolite transporter (DMT)-like permease
MTSQTTAYFYALAASVSFSTASLFFAVYAKNISSLWMNYFKTTICFICLTLSLVFFVKWQAVPISVVGALVVSGILGLGLGDLFLLSAFARMGAGRTLILFGFQPLILGVSSWYLFAQPLSLYKLIAVFFFLICLFLFSLEKFKEEGHWEIKGLIAALLGVMFDNSGILLTRWSFDSAPEMGVVQANFIRASGALLFYFTFNPFLKSGLIQHFKKLTQQQKIVITVASAAGTFVSLVLYLSAVRVAHLASLSAIGVFGPLYSTTLECVIAKKAPSRYLILALFSFLIGFVILLLF